MKDILIQNLPEIENKIHVLPRQVRPSMKRNQYLTQRSLVIVFSGRITQEKGLHLAIEALFDLHIEEEIVFKIAGVLENETYWSHCLELAKKVETNNPSVKIQYLGHLSYQDVDSLYTEADVVVVPSIWGEPSGTVAAEALRSGTAVVASNVGGINIWVIDQQTGLLIRPNDVAALSEALRRLLSNGVLRQNLANAGKELINSRFNGEEHIKALSEVIEQCQAGKTGRCC